MSVKVIYIFKVWVKFKSQYSPEKETVNRFEIQHLLLYIFDTDCFKEKFFSKPKRHKARQLMNNSYYDLNFTEFKLL